MSKYIKKNTKSMRYGLCMIMAVLLMTACSSEQNDDPVRRDDEGRVALQLTACMPTITVETVTRAAGNAWEANDAIGVFAVDHNRTTVTADGSNVSYQVASAGTGYQTFNPTGAPLYLPISGAAADVCAYYPYKNDVTDPTQVVIDLTDQTDQKAIDWMSSGRTQYTTQGGTTPITRENPTCQLLFSHRMCKIQFNITNGDGITAGDLANNPSMEVRGLSPVGYLNLLTGAVTINGGTTVVFHPQEMATAAGGYVKSFEATVLPQVAGDSQVTFVIGTSPQARYTFTLPGREFVAGKRYIYNVTVRNKAVSVTSTVTDWTAGVSGGGVVYI